MPDAYTRARLSSHTTCSLGSTRKSVSFIRIVSVTGKGTESTTRLVMYFGLYATIVSRMTNVSTRSTMVSNPPVLAVFRPAMNPIAPTISRAKSSMTEFLIYLRCT